MVLEVLQDGGFTRWRRACRWVGPEPSAGQTVTPHYMALDERLEVTSYHGAFHPVLEPWFVGWSTLDDLGLFSGRWLTEGCTYDFACNYDPLALVDDGSCERESCAGCTFQHACNYDPMACWTTGRAPWRMLRMHLACRGC